MSTLLSSFPHEWLRWRRFVLPCILLANGASIVVCYAVIALVALVDLAPTETRIEKYSVLRSEWNEYGRAAHFPGSIPATATNVRLSAFPGMMQSEDWFQVRMTLPANEVAVAYDHAAKVAKHSFAAGAGSISNSNQDAWMAAAIGHARFHTSDTGDTVFPTDYRVFILDGNPGNHGETYGIAVSKQRSEVVYYLEEW